MNTCVSGIIPDWRELKEEKMKEYRSVAARGEGEIVIKKSRFIGQATPVASEAEAVAFVAEIKKRRYDATHNCHAWIIDSLNQRSSDDGEPAGTAGRPMLEVLRREELERVVVVVSRYFGGVLLGANGLIRAYAQACKTGLQAAVMGWMRLFQKLTVTVDYTLYGPLENLIRERDILVLDSAFAETVTVTMGLPLSEIAPAQSWLRDFSSGQAVTTPGPKYYKFVKGR